MHRFRFLGDILSPQKEAVIIGDELHHLKKVVRLKLGDEVEVFTGKGQSGFGRIEKIDSSQALVCLASLKEAPPPAQCLHFAMGALKPQSMDEIVPALVELGVGAFHVIWQKDTPKFRVDEKVSQRWSRIILGACKQSKRDFLPEVRVWQELTSFLSWAKAHTDQRFVLDQSEARESLSALASASQIVLLAGGERGFTTEEKNLILASDFRGLSLSPHVLRATTAAVAGSAVLSFATLPTP